MTVKKVDVSNLKDLPICRLLLRNTDGISSFTNVEMNQPANLVSFCIVTYQSAAARSVCSSTSSRHLSTKWPTSESGGSSFLRSHWETLSHRCIHDDCPSMPQKNLYMPRKSLYIPRFQHRLTQGQITVYHCKMLRERVFEPYPNLIGREYQLQVRRLEISGELLLSFLADKPEEETDSIV